MPQFVTQEQLRVLTEQVANLVLQQLVERQVTSALLATHPDPRAVIQQLQTTTSPIENSMLFSAGVLDAQLETFRKLLQVRIADLLLAARHPG